MKRLLRHIDICFLTLALILCVSNSCVFATTTVDFADVTPGDWYYTPVKWAAEHNITKGVHGTSLTFAPKESCTRAEAVTFLYNYFKIK